MRKRQLESSLVILVLSITKSAIHILKQGTETESSFFHFCALFLLYALGLVGLRVTGLMVQMPRRLVSSSRFFFFESLAYGMNFSMMNLPFLSCCRLHLDGDRQSPAQGSGNALQRRHGGIRHAPLDLGDIGLVDAGQGDQLLL